MEKKRQEPKKRRRKKKPKGQGRVDLEKMIRGEEEGGGA